MQVNDLMRNSSNTNITWQLSAWLIRQSKSAKFSFATVCGAIFANVKLDFDTKNVSQAFTPVWGKILGGKIRFCANSRRM